MSADTRPAPERPARSPAKRPRAILPLLALLLTATPAAARELPPAPAGYDWLAVDALDLAVLRPVGWRLIDNQGKLLGSFALTPAPDTRSTGDGRKSPDVPGGRHDGTDPPRLNVYAVDRLGGASGVPLSRQIDGFAAALAASSGYHVLSRETRAYGTFRGVGLHYRAGRDSAGAVVQRGYRLYLGDDRRDRLLIVDFVAPRAGWAAAWRIGRVLTAQLVVGGAGRRGPEAAAWGGGPDAASR